MKAFVFSILFVLALWPPQPSTATELQAGVFIKPGSTWSQPFERWIEKVNADGEIKIRLIGPEVINTPEQPQAIKSGKLDIVALPTGAYQNLVPEASAQDLSNLSLAQQRATGGYAAINELLRRKLNAFALTTYGAGVPFHLYLTTPIRSLNELKGLRVRAQPLHHPLMQALGLNVVTTNLPDLNAALEHEIVQVYTYSLLGIDDFGWHHKTVQRIEPGFYESVINILVNQDTWHKLSPNEQASLIKASSWLEEYLPPRLKKAIEDAYVLQEFSSIGVLQAPRTFAEQAQAIYWRELEQKSPAEIPRLKALLVQ